MSPIIEGGTFLLNAGAPSNGTTEVQTLTIGGTPTGGTFRLAYDGQVTDAITWTATDATLVTRIQTALRALANIGSGGVTVTNSTLSSGIGNALLTFGGNLAKLAINTVSIYSNDLTGSAPTLAVTETTPGVSATARDASVGALLLDITNAALYVNTGTALAPTWTLIGTVSAGTVTEAMLVPGAADAGLSGLVAKFAADGNVLGAIPVIHRKTIASGANGNTDITLTMKTRVLFAWFVMKGAGTTGCTLQLQNVTTAITEAFDCSAKGDKAVCVWVSIDDAQHEIAAGAKMRIVKASTGGDFPGAEVYVVGVPVA